MIDEELSKIEDKEVAALLEKQILEKIQRILDNQNRGELDWKDPYLVDKWYSGRKFDQRSYDFMKETFAIPITTPKKTAIEPADLKDVVYPKLDHNYASSIKTWCTPKIIEEWERLNPGMKFSRKDVTRMFKPKLGDIWVNTRTDIPDLIPINKEGLKAWYSNFSKLGKLSEDAVTILTIFALEDKEHTEPDGSTSTIQRVSRGFLDYIGSKDKNNVLFRQVSRQPFKYAELEYEDPTQEVLDILKYKLESRHLLENRHLNKPAITAELFKLLGKVYDISQLERKDFESIHSIDRKEKV